MNRKNRSRSANLSKSSSEPDLNGFEFSDHFTPRFPFNLKKLLHEYVEVDELKQFRKKKSDVTQSKSNFSLYDETLPNIPFSELKTEYCKEFGNNYPIRSRSVPKKIVHLNETTSELIEALRDDDTDVITMPRERPKTAKIIGDIEIRGDEKIVNSIIKPYAQVRQSDEAAPNVQATTTADPNEMNLRSCTLKLEGELTYMPEYRSEYRSHAQLARSKSIPQIGSIKFQGNFQGAPEYKDNFQANQQMTKTEAIKPRNHLKLNSNVSPLPDSEYRNRFNDKSVRGSAKSKSFKQFDNFTLRNDSIGGSQRTMPEYNDNFRAPSVCRVPPKPKPKSPILSMKGDMEYKPEYRSSFVDFPRARPLTKRAETHIDFFEAPPSIDDVDAPPIHRPPPPPILRNRFPTRIAVIEPSKNVHHPTGINEDPTYLCRPEARKARRELLIRKRPPSPEKTLAAAIRSTGPVPPIDEEEENRIFEQKSRIITSAKAKTKIPEPPIQVTVENVDEPNEKPATVLRANTLPKYGRRSSNVSHSPKTSSKLNVQKQRNRSKIIEGNRNYSLDSTKRNSFTSTTSTTDDDSQMANRKTIDESEPSFVVLRENKKQSKWMNTSWYN